MKKLIGILLATLMLWAVAFAAEPVDLTTYTDAELDALRLQVAEEIRTRKMTEVPESALADLRYASNGKEVRIIEYIGDGGDLYIPDEIDGVPVTQLYRSMCENHRNISSLRLPAGLVSIGWSAFQYTNDLEQVLVMPASLEVIETAAFWSSSVTGLVLQSDCTVEGQSFSDADELEFCYIREGCAVTLGYLTFHDASLETIVIPADVTSISSGAFEGCNQLTVYCPAGSYAEQFCQENFIICDTANYEAMVAYYEALYPAE